MSTAKMVLVSLVMLVAFGIVGRMDYDDAKRMERVTGNVEIRLFCVRFPMGASAERGPSKSRRATALLITDTPTTNVGVLEPAVLRCVVVDE